MLFCGPLHVFMHDLSLGRDSVDVVGAGRSSAWFIDLGILAGDRCVGEGSAGR